MADASHEVKLSAISANCLKKDPSYGKGVTDALTISPEERVENLERCPSSRLATGSKAHHANNWKVISCCPQSYHLIVERRKT